MLEFIHSSGWGGGERLFEFRWEEEGVGAYSNKYGRSKYSRTSPIRTPKGQSEMSVLGRCPCKRGHYDDVTFMAALTVLSVQ